MAENQDNSRPITNLLVELRKGNKEAEAQLIPLVYNELHRLARHYMRGNGRATPSRPAPWSTKPTCA